MCPDRSNGARSARDRLAELASRDEADIDLAEGALLIAAEARPELVVERCLGLLDELASKTRDRVAAAESALDCIARLNRFLFDEMGFVGNQQDYYDPRNSLLDCVLERRTGIPITLSIVYIEVARRLGLDVRGVSFPGHFLVRAAELPILIDPFHGRLLTRDDCEALLREVQGEDAKLAPNHVRPARKGEILARVLLNLKQVYLQREEFEAALACCDRILLFTPDAPLEHRDRGLIYAKLECFGPALADLERFVELLGRRRPPAAVEELLESLRERVRRIH